MLMSPLYVLSEDTIFLLCYSIPPALRTTRNDQYHDGPLHSMEGRERGLPTKMEGERMFPKYYVSGNTDRLAIVPYSPEEPTD